MKKKGFALFKSYMTGESLRNDLSGVTGVIGIDTLKELAAQVALAGSCLLVLTHANMSH